MPSEPFQQQTVLPLIPDKEQSHSQLLASDDLMSPHSLDAILNLPAMSFDSGQDMQALELQPDTPQSQHMPAAAQQHLPDNSSHIQQHQLLEAMSQHCQNQHQHEQLSYQGHEPQQHYSSAHEQQSYQGHEQQQHYSSACEKQRFSGALQQQQQQQHASCYSSGSQETGLQPLHPAPLGFHQDLGSSLQWADSCPVPTALPNVIRKTSSDSTIE